MKIYKYIILLLFFSCLANSQTRDEQVLKGIDYVYRVKFDSANTIFQSFIQQDTKDPAGYFFISMSEWWRIFVNKDDYSNDDNYKSKVDKCIEVCDSRLEANENDETALFYKGGAIGYRGFLYSMRENWINATSDGREGLNLLKRCLEINPGNKDAVFGVGLYNYAYDLAINKYPFLKAMLFFFPKGDKELGITQLRDCSENAKYSKTEALFVLCRLYLQYEKNFIEAEKYASKLNKMYPENPVFERYLANSYVGVYNFTDAVSLYKGMIAKGDSGIYGYSNKKVMAECYYYLAYSQSQTSQLDDALANYQKALSLSHEADKDDESAVQVYSALGIGIIYDQKGNRADAIKYYDMVLNMKNVENSKENAQKFKDKGLK
jgi:hypothetical protein